MPKIYHYTGAMGVLGIIKDGLIRCTNINFLNDRTEHKYAYDEFMRVCDKKKNEALKGTPWENLYKSLGVFCSRNVKDAYVTCFTYKDDENIFWKSYGAPSARYSIEFDKEKLARHIHDIESNNSNIFNHFVPRTSDVSYSTQKANEILDIDSLQKKMPPHTKDKEDLPLHMFNESCYFFASTKNPEWEHENEFRIILSERKSVDRENGNYTYDPGKESIINFFERDGMLIPYINIPVSRDLITKITYQTDRNDNRIEESLKLLKRLYNANFKIKKSESSFCR